MGFFSFLSSCVSSICSGISNLVGSIGGALSSFAHGVGSVIAGVIDAVAPVAQSLAKFASAFLQGLGIIKPEEKPEDIGDRALQAADKGITIDKFENFDDYMKALRDYQLDPELSAKRSHTEKLVAGIGVGTVGIEKKYNAAPGSLDGLWLLPMTNPAYFTPQRMQTLITAGRLGADVFSYLEKKLSDGEARRFEISLEVGSDGRRMDENELGQLYDALDTARDNWSDIMRQLQAKANPAQGV